jgi:hypothetical protein
MFEGTLFPIILFILFSTTFILFLLLIDIKKFKSKLKINYPNSIDYLKYLQQFENSKPHKSHHRNN